MEETINDRVKELRTFLNLSQTSFSDMVCIKQGTLSDIERKRINVSHKTIGKISERLGASKDWLYTGNGTMLNPETTDQSSSREPINERLNKLIRKLNISKNRFGRSINISSSLISQITSGSHNFGIDIIQKICIAYPEVNIYWLLTGEGEMYNNTNTARPSDLPTLPPVPLFFLMDVYIDYTNILISGDHPITEARKRNIQLLNSLLNDD